MWISLSPSVYQDGILRLGINEDLSSDPPPPKKRFKVPNVIIPNFSNNIASPPKFSMTMQLPPPSLTYSTPTRFISCTIHSRFTYETKPMTIAYIPSTPKAYLTSSNWEQKIPIRKRTSNKVDLICWEWVMGFNLVSWWVSLSTHQWFGWRIFVGWVSWVSFCSF